MSKNRLTNPQKASVAAIANQAWELGRSEGRIVEPPPRGKTRAIRVWRHTETAAATDGQAASLDEATQLHFCNIMGHFHHLADEDDKAFKWFAKADGEPRRQANWHLARVLAAEPTSMGAAYAESIMRDKFDKSDESTLTVPQIWHLIFTLNRAKSRALKAPCNPVAAD